MPLDAICLTAVKLELEERIVGQKIDKVQQPERDIVVLSLRGGDRPPCKLLISAGSGDMRAHLTEHRFDNPDSPPMFCMLLRKHLTGARITGIRQPPAERILEITLDAPDAMGVLCVKRLILELIGRLSNIILADGDGLIVDCLRRVGGDLTDKRAILPGLLYRPPTAQQGKLDPLKVTPCEWRELFDTTRSLTCDRWLLDHFRALSPLICRELSWRAYGEVDIRADAVRDGGEALGREFFALMGAAASENYEAWVMMAGGCAPRDFSYTRIMQYEGAADAIQAESFSEMLDDFYTRAQQLKRIRQRASATGKTVKTARGRIARKLAAQQAELVITADRDYLRECGDIITANLHLMKKGQHILAAQDFYAGDGTAGDGTVREIALDPRSTPQQNAAKYYKDYNKAKNAEKSLTEQIRLGESELEYLDSVIEEIALAENERDIIEIRRELVETGYIREDRKGQVKGQVKGKGKGKGKQAVSAPMMFKSSTGLQILTGRSNTQNDKLTLKTALKSDVWLHTQKIHGSHVIISCGGNPPDEQSLLEAAAIAAYYSAARSGGKVPVDYTQVKYVKKPAGARPGMVIYTNHKTLIASPDEVLVSRLRIDK